MAGLKVCGIGLSIFFFCLGVGQASAQPSPGDKSQYHLFNPTPRHLMRPLSADRPDATESPRTVDAGHIQIESSFFEYTLDQRNSASQTDVGRSFLATNVKLGLFNHIDLQLVFEPYARQTSDPDSGPAITSEGFGDIQLRLKVNVWGNDSGQTAFGIMPFIKIPTGTALSNDKVEGGFIAMLAWEVAHTWELGFMAEVDAVYDEVEDDYDLAFTHTVVWGMDVVGPLGAYLEYLGVADVEGHNAYRASASVGLTYSINEDTILEGVWKVILTPGPSGEA